MADAGLKQSVQSQMVAAMKAGDKMRTQVLRMVLSEIKAQEADKPDADPQAAVSAYAKKLKKAQADMERLNQGEHVAQLKAELAIVDEFLPRQMDDAALEALVAQTMTAMGAVSGKDAGRIMGAVLKAAAGTADPSKVKALVAAKLPPE